MLILPPEWESLWDGKDPFLQIFALQGQEYRNMDGRRTLRFELLGESYFVKMYQGIGWWRILRSILTLRKPPVLSARNEWQAIDALHKVGIDTLTTVAYGERGRSPATRQSFLVTKELTETESLEDFCRLWSVHPPTARLKRALIKRVAEMTHTLHQQGMNHRDLYLCHFLLDISTGRDLVNLDNFHLYLIDLHRVQFQSTITFRRRLKDLSALYFSSMEIGLTSRDLYRFIRDYTQEPLPRALRDKTFLWQQVRRRGEKLHKRFQRKFQT